MSISLVAIPVADIDVASLAINETALEVHLILLPLAFVDVTLKTDVLALSFTREVLMLAVVHVSVSVEELAHGTADALVE